MAAEHVVDALPVLLGRGPVVPLAGGRVPVHGVGVEVERVREAGRAERRLDGVAVGERRGRVVVAPAEVHLGGRALEVEVR